MTRYTTTSSRPHESVLPKPQSGFTREYTHGPLERDEALLLSIWSKIGRAWPWLFGACIGGAVLLFGLPMLRFGLINLGVDW